MHHKQQKHFGITLMASFVIHFFVLTAMFTLPAPESGDEYKMVRVKFGVKKNTDGVDVIASARKYAAYAPAAGNINQKSTDGNGTQNVPAIAPAAKEVIKQELAEPKGQVQEKSVAPIPARGETVSQEPAPAQPPEVQKVVEQVANDIEKAVPLPVVKRAQEHWSEDGVAIGNSSDNNAGKLASYEQMLPLWLEKFKKYPAEARESHITGKGELFIKIDRKGRVLLAKVIETTAFPALDRAIMKMIADADPVLPVPPDYHPDRKTFSYRIAIVFDEPGL